MFWPPLFEITEPAHTNTSQTGRHAAEQKVNVRRATPIPVFLSLVGLGNIQVFKDMSSSSTQK